MTPKAVALIPARSGSLRVPGKNVKELAGHPLIAYSIAAAQDSGLFEAVVVSTNDERTAEVARRYGAEVPGLRPEEMATSTSPDIEWIAYTLRLLADEGREFDLFSILRPTSPFRTADTIRRAWEALLAHGDGADSIRAVEPVRQHPAKMWTIEDGRLQPLLPSPPGETPLHSRQFHSLPPVYVQDSSLEIAWTRVVEEHGSISGERIVAFVSEGLEGFSIDYPDDWEVAERFAATEAALPRVRVS